MIRYDIKKYVETYHNNLITGDSSNFFIPMFHGTDRNIIKMSSEERSALKDACLTIIPKLYSLYVDNDLLHHPAIKTIKHYPKVMTAYSNANGLVNSSSYYSYNHTYFTNGLDRALTYANNSTIFGELGSTAYILYIALTELNFPIPTLSEKEEAALKLILQQAKRKPEPIVLMFTDLDKNLLADEFGDDLGDYFLNAIIETYYKDHGSGMVLSFRYLEPVDLSKGIVVDISKVTILK